MLKRHGRTRTAHCDSAKRQSGKITLSEICKQLPSKSFPVLGQETIHQLADLHSTMVARFAARLPSRGLVQVSGVDSQRFLQGLVTSDLHALSPTAPTSSTAFLNTRGRILFGALLHRNSETSYLIDTPLPRLPALIAHLKQYRLRSKADIVDATAAHSVWSIIGSSPSDHLERQATHGTTFNDPRLPALGKRAFVERDFPGFDGVPAGTEEGYTRLRIMNGVPDGPDFDGEPLPLDLAMHLLGAVSFTKGCYLGQELTARSHFTGVLRKRLTPIAVVGEGEGGRGLERGMEISVEGKTKRAGVVSSAVDRVGLAVMRISDTFGERGGTGKTLRLGDGRLVRAWQPDWWDVGAGEVAL